MTGYRNLAKIQAFIGTKRQRLTAVKVARYIGSKQVWLFSCECGGQKEMPKGNFLNSNTNNCGCRHGLTTHGMATKEYVSKNKVKRWPAYHSWVNMRQRCNNPSNPDYKYYGGRGIKACKRWNSFSNFLKDMGEPAKGLTLDRIDNNKGYKPSNCKWSTRKEQSVNRRPWIQMGKLTHIID